MDDNKLCSFGQAGLRNFYVVAELVLAELWRKDSWFGFALMVPAKKSPRRAFVGGGVMTDRSMNESERKVSFEFNIKNQRGDPTT